MKGHNLASLSVAKQKKALNQPSSAPTQVPFRPTQQSLPTTPFPSIIGSSTYTTWDGLAKALRDEDPVIQLKRRDAERLEAEHCAADEELAKELQEQEEHHALLASVRAALQSPSGHSSPIPASSFPPSPSNRFPSTLDVSTRFLVAGLPVTQASPSNRPKITTQMNDTWMRDYEDHTKDVQQRKGRGQIDFKVVQKFWAKWKIQDSPSTLQRLGDGLLQFYDINHNLWVESDPAYPHTLQTDCYLLLRCTGVICQDFENHLAAARHKPTNQRTYMTKIRQSVKSKALKGKGKAQARSHSDDDSDGEVEFVEIPSEPPQILKLSPFQFLLV